MTYEEVALYQLEHGNPSVALVYALLAVADELKRAGIYPPTQVSAGSVTNRTQDGVDKSP